jgi:hypothetical protein
MLGTRPLFERSRRLRVKAEPGGRPGGSIFGVLCELYRVNVRKGIWREESELGVHFVLNGVIYTTTCPPEVEEWSGISFYDTVELNGEKVVLGFAQHLMSNKQLKEALS